MITKLFNKPKNIIWMVHFPPLIWFEWYPWQNIILHKMKKDAINLIEWWIDSIIIENNYDLPHTKYLEPEIISQMTFLALELRKTTNIPIWICCLWNDRKASLSIAKIANLDFVRIPVFVDKIETHYWFEIQENPEDIIHFRKKIQAQNIKIITDIHVKHCKILNSDTIEESAINAIKSWSDWLIITWKWTWDLPKFYDLENVRKAVWNFPIIIWSWVDEKNITSVLNIVDAMIVWTSLKTQKYSWHTINIKAWEEEIDWEKVKKLIQWLL